MDVSTVTTKPIAVCLSVCTRCDVLCRYGHAGCVDQGGGVEEGEYHQHDWRDTQDTRHTGRLVSLSVSVVRLAFT